VHPLLNQAGHLVDGWQGNQFQKEYLKVFFLVLQVSSLYVVSTFFQLHPFMKEIQT
jgi:MAternally-affected-uncoordination protein